MILIGQFVAAGSPGQPTAQKSIERVLQKNDIDWATVYLLPQKTTTESRLRIFQYKILNNISGFTNFVM